jgi:hypothetical protein
MWYCRSSPLCQRLVRTRDAACENILRRRCAWRSLFPAAPPSDAILPLPAQRCGWFLRDARENLRDARQQSFRVRVERHPPKTVPEFVGYSLKFSTIIKSGTKILGTAIASGNCFQYSNFEFDSSFEFRASSLSLTNVDQKPLKITNNVKTPESACPICPAIPACRGLTSFVMHPPAQKNYSIYSHQVFVVSQSVTPASFAFIASSFGLSIR